MSCGKELNVIFIIVSNTFVNLNMNHNEHIGHGLSVYYRARTTTSIPNPLRYLIGLNVNKLVTLVAMILWLLLLPTVAVVIWSLLKMMKPGKPLFAVGYMLYARTRVGEWMHQKDLQKFREQYPDGHSKVTATELGDVKIRPIPLLEDNYAYLVIDKSTDTAVVVDPADAAAVKKVIEEENVRLSAIFTTHKHWDHAGGNLELRADYKHVSIYGNKKDNIPGCTNYVKDGDGMQVGNLNFRAIFTPGHTVGHTIYLLEARPGCPQCVFTGDCLFLSGCGRTFEGSCATMVSSLDKICELDDTTLVWPGHEYAKDNLEFARSIEPENAAISEKLSWVKGQRLERNITSPSTVAEEKSYNPFLRTKEGSVLTSLGYDATESAGADITDLRSKALAEIRHRKDSFNYKL